MRDLQAFSRHVAHQWVATSENRSATASPTASSGTLPGPGGSLPARRHDYAPLSSRTPGAVQPLIESVQTAVSELIGTESLCLLYVANHYSASHDYSLQNLELLARFEGRKYVFGPKR